jgi:hypothetical protein
MAIPLLNERDRRGTKIRVSTADFTPIARMTPQKKGAVYDMQIRIVGVRVLTALGAQPAAYAYLRRITVVTDSTGAVTQVGTTQTLGTDNETDAGATINIAVDSSLGVTISASDNVDTVTNDQVLVG